MAKQKDSEVEVPDRTSTEWNDYVMSLFDEAEMIDEAPRVFGLRRVAEMLVGEIVESRTVNVQVLDFGGPIGKTANVTYRITFSTPNGEKKVFADTADVWEGNTPDLFLVHPAATAATKAEARVLRKALGIYCLAAEELDNDRDASEYLSKQSGQKEERINQNQITFLNSRCKKLDIDVMKFVNNFDENEYLSINEVKKDVAVNMVQEITELLKGEKEVDEKLLGYSEDWRDK